MKTRILSDNPPGSPAGKAVGRASAEPVTWQELCDVIVSFGYAGGYADENNSQQPPQIETRAYYSQCDRFMRWPGIADQELMAWILAQVQEVLPHASAARLGVRLPRLEVVSLTVTAVEPDLPGSVTSLRAKSNVRLNKTEDGSRTPVKFRLQFLLTETETSQTKSIATEAEIIPGEPAREITCDFPVPPAGRYQVKTILQTWPAGEVLAQAIGPFVRVTP